MEAIAVFQDTSIVRGAQAIPLIPFKMLHQLRVFPAGCRSKLAIFACLHNGQSGTLLQLSGIVILAIYCINRSQNGKMGRHVWSEFSS
jgi:hypothetical protein